MTPRPGLDTDLATLRAAITRVRDGVIIVGKGDDQEVDAALDRVEAELARLREERDSALRIAPAVRQVIEKALRRDMTKPPVTRAELQFALDLLPEPPSFRSSVDGMEALAAAQTECARLRQALRHIDHWPFDVNKSSVDDLREIKDFAREALAGPDTPADNSEKCPKGGTHARIAHPNGRCIKCGGSPADSQACSLETVRVGQVKPPYHTACQCGYWGPPRDVLDEAISDARVHARADSQPEETT